MEEGGDEGRGDDDGVGDEGLEEALASGNVGEGEGEDSETVEKVESDEDGDMELSEEDVEWRVISSKDRSPELSSSWSSESKSNEGG
jgi:hypothetical protein